MSSPPLLLTRRRPVSERVIEAALFAAAVLGVLTTAGIILVLAAQTFEFFLQVSPVDFLTGTRWSAAIRPYVDATPDAKYRKDFERWLKGDCWESAVVPARRVNTNGHQPYRNSADPNAYFGDLA